MKLEFIGSGIDEVGVVREVSGELAHSSKVEWEIVRVDPRYFRPTEVEELLGIRVRRGKSYRFRRFPLEEMCHEMIESDLEEAKKNRILIDFGHDLSITGRD